MVSDLANRPWPPPGHRVREPPAHLDHPSRARFSIPNDDGQQTANAIGDDFVVAALVATWFFASAALCERLGKRDDFTPGCQSREFTAHGGTLSSPRSGTKAAILAAVATPSRRAIIWPPGNAPSPAYQARGRPTAFRGGCKEQSRADQRPTLRAQHNRSPCRTGRTILRCR